MKQIFNAEAKGTLVPTLYYGGIVKDDGEFKLEWNDPKSGQTLVTEEDLRALEESSRNALGEVETGSEDWEYQRNVHYSAEYGLERLQQFKLAENLNLTTPLRPVVR